MSPRPPGGGRHPDTQAHRVAPERRRRSRQLFRAAAQPQQAITEPPGHRTGRNPQKISGLPPGVSAAGEKHRLTLRPRKRRQTTMRQQAPPSPLRHHMASPRRPPVGYVAAAHRRPSTIHRAAPRDRHDPAQPAACRRTEPRRGPPHLHQYLPGHLLRPGLIPDDPAHQAVNRAGDLITDTRETPQHHPARSVAAGHQLRPHRAVHPPALAPPTTPYPPSGNRASARQPWLPHLTPVNDHRAARVRDSATTQRCHTLTQPGPDIHNHPVGLIRPPQ